ncbi:MAG: DUF4738 domain-containing protein [Aestuariibaculum sp.]
MYKFIFLLCISISFISCDGRARKYKDNREILKGNNLLRSFSEEITFTPKSYTEINTDTILSSGFRVKIKYYSLEHDYIVKSVKLKTNSITKHYYKNFEAKLDILKDNTLVVSQNITKHHFLQFVPKNFRDKAIMQSLWINEENTTPNSIYLNTCLLVPETGVFKDFSIIIHHNGQIEIKEKNIS